MVALATPYAMRRWSEEQLLSGKEQQFQGHTYNANNALLLCLLKREPGGLALQIISENHFSDPARALAVTVEEHTSFRIVRAYLPKAARLTPGELGQLHACLGRPSAAPAPAP